MQNFEIMQEKTADICKRCGRHLSIIRHKSTILASNKSLLELYCQSCKSKYNYVCSLIIHGDSPFQYPKPLPIKVRIHSRSNFRNPYRLYEDEIRQFPDLDTYKTNLKKSKEMDLSCSTLQEIEDVFYDHTLHFSKGIRFIHPENFNTQTFYRARFGINPDDEEKFLFHTYPDPKYCTKNGRANLKSKSVFYCSDNYHASILECKPGVGQIGYLGVWKPLVRNMVKCACFISNKLKDGNRWKQLAEDNYNKNDVGLLAHGGSDIKAHLKALMDFVNQKFIDEEEPYPLTSWLSDITLFGEIANDMMIYPSVASETLYCNIAFSPKFVDQNLFLFKLIKFQLLEMSKEKVKIKSISEAQPRYSIQLRKKVLE